MQPTLSLRRVGGMKDLMDLAEKLNDDVETQSVIVYKD
jgi:hypothetical protein